MVDAQVSWLAGQTYGGGRVVAPSKGRLARTSARSTGIMNRSVLVAVGAAIIGFAAVAGQADVKAAGDKAAAATDKAPAMVVTTNKVTGVVTTNKVVLTETKVQAEKKAE